MKKIIGIVLSCGLVLGLSQIEKTNLLASDVDFSTSDTVLESSLKNYQELGCGVDLYQYRTKAYNDGIINDSKLGDFTVSWFDYGTNDVRIVNWTGGSYNEWGGATATALSHDYEQKHPGYLVIGAVNGDFFHIANNCEVMNVSIQEGDLYKPYQWQAFGTGVIGWKYDGTIVSGNPTISTNMYLETYDDEGNKLNEVEIASVNNGISNTGISLLTADITNTYDFNGCDVCVIQYDVHRYLQDGNHNHDRLYISGIITDKKQINNTEAVESYKAYLVSKDGSLNNYQISDNVKCQYHLTGDWAEVVNSTGYYAQILKDGKSLFKNSTSVDYSNLVSDKSYINCQKNRTVIGMKEDGSTVLMTIEYDLVNKKMGASYYECAEYLRLIGCSQGWLLDGGGSTTLAIRNDNGDHITIGGCSDGSERRDGNAILLVVKDPGISAVVDDASRYEATISIRDTGSIFRDQVTIESITIGDQTIPYNGNPITFTNLEENTKYVAKVSYTLTSGSKVTKSALYRTFYTANFEYPTVSIKAIQTCDDAILIKKNVSYRNNVEEVYNCKILCNDQTYDFSGDTCLVTGLSSKKNYTLKMEYDCKEAGTGKIYHGSSASITVSTTTNPRPMVISLKVNKVINDTITFDFEYYDPNNLVTRAYIDCYGMEVDVTGKSGSIDFEGIDVTSGDFPFTLNLSYGSDLVTGEEVIVTKDDITKEEKPDVNPTPQEEKKKGCKKNTAFVISLISMVSILGLILKKKH